MLKWRMLGWACFLAAGVMVRGAELARALPTVELRLVAEGFTSPLAMAELPDGRKLVADQIGLLHALGTDGQRIPEPVADLRPKMVELNPNYDERGMLDVVLHPRFQRNHRLLLAYNAPLTPHALTNWNCSLVISEFTLSPASQLRLDLASEKVLLRIDKPFANHNGGRMAFGPDGYLYIGVGDGGGGNDEGLRPREGNGQNLDTLLGKVLRIDIDGGRPYAIPDKNPWASGVGARPEIYAYGFRNPWGLSFDRGRIHALFVADVGQNLFEEVDMVERGGNYGWNRREGFHPFDAQRANTVLADGVTNGLKSEPLLDPILEYPHRAGDPAAPQGVSVTGGYVYRGKAIEGLAGMYVFADWTRTRGVVGDGRLMAAVRPFEGTKWALEYLPVAGRPFGKLDLYIVALAQDNNGELYVLTNNRGVPTGQEGRIWKIVSGKGK
ncbi:MAG TPA: PQQ-dependent sugar dehydrogenase [Candidatus Limnocylindria bacterium]|jgi:glucose/arabinose dehydrogenase|nr:PQQ-dependent sugar dehydrogenase [Candidatus Limnocylindria bacterium]